MINNALYKGLKPVKKEQLISYAEKYNKRVAERRIQYRANDRESQILIAKARLTD